MTSLFNLLYNVVYNTLCDGILVIPYYLLEKGRVEGKPEGEMKYWWNGANNLVGQELFERFVRPGPK